MDTKPQLSDKDAIRVFAEVVSSPEFRSYLQYEIDCDIVRQSTLREDEKERFLAVLKEDYEKNYAIHQTRGQKTD